MNMNTFTRWMAGALLTAAALTARAQPDEPIVVTKQEQVASSPELDAFRAQLEQKYPGMDVMVQERRAYEGIAVPRPTPIPPPSSRNLAIFVKNQTKKAHMDDEVDGFRDLIAAELAGYNVTVLDKEMIADSFSRYKITTAEERAGLISGIFSGGSATRVAEMIGADYLMLVSINYADTMRRAMSGKTVFTYKITCSARAMNSAGKSVYGKTFSKSHPVVMDVVAVDAEDNSYFHMLMERLAGEIAADAGGSINGWPSGGAGAPQNLVTFTVRTTIDSLVDGLQEGVRAPNELLDEVRHVVGGVTVEVDGAVVGSTPGMLQATPGLHQVRVTRQWMQPWTGTVMIRDGLVLDVGLELSDAGIQRWRNMEGFKAGLALTYAEAAYRKDIKINFDTSAWRDVTLGNTGNAGGATMIQIQQNR